MNTQTDLIDPKTEKIKDAIDALSAVCGALRRLAQELKPCVDSINRLVKDADDLRPIEVEYTIK